MMRSMYSAVSGLAAHQTKMDVIGNNISNVNTVGFKSGRVTFQEVFSQTIRGASTPQEGRGGTNPQQIGLGANVAAIDTIFTRGAAESTGVARDLMINGDNGFFIVSNDANFSNRSYTRAGNFDIDRDGNLVTKEGYRVLGYRADGIGENAELKTSLEGLVISQATTFPAQVTGTTGTYATSPSKESDVRLEGNLNSDTALDAVITGKDTDATAGNDKFYMDKSKLIGRETTIKVYDEFGGEHELKITFSRKLKGTATIDDTTGEITGATFADPANPKASEILEPNEWEMTVTSLDGEPLTPASTTKTAITFSNGNIVNDKINIQVGNGGKFANGAGTFNFNLSFRDEKGDPSVTQFSNESKVTGTTLTGYKQGSLDSYTISSSGEIIGIFDNGQQSLLGMIAIANFKNPAGLQKTQSNMFVDTANSGSAIIGTPGASGFASLTPGSLEMSNVDLSREFTNMITTQRGFQANSRVITTTDQMLEELVNLKR